MFSCVIISMELDTVKVHQLFVFVFAFIEKLICVMFQASKSLQFSLSLLAETNKIYFVHVYEMKNIKYSRIYCHIYITIGISFVVVVIRSIC